MTCVSMCGQVRESRLVDMVGQLERARAAGVSPAERAQCLDSITAEAGRVRSGRAADSAAAVLAKVRPLCLQCARLSVCSLDCAMYFRDASAQRQVGMLFLLQHLSLKMSSYFTTTVVKDGGFSTCARYQLVDEGPTVRSTRLQLHEPECCVLQVAEYIKVEDFDGAESAAALAGPEGAARTEALRLVSYMLQANRSQEGTIVTVKDIINLPREVGAPSAMISLPLASASSCLSTR